MTSTAAQAPTRRTPDDELALGSMLVAAADVATGGAATGGVPVADAPERVERRTARPEAPARRPRRARRDGGGRADDLGRAAASSRRGGDDDRADTSEAPRAAARSASAPAPAPAWAPASRAGLAPASTPASASAPALAVVRQRHWARWIVGAVILFLAAQFAWTFVSNERWEWGVFAEYFFAEPVLKGLQLTLLLTLAGTVLGFALGTVLAVLRLSTSPLLNGAAWSYIWFFRSVPLVVQLVVWYNLGYLFPQLGLGWPFTYDFWIVSFDTTTLISQAAAAILGLGLHQAAYAAEIIRAGILSVDQGQLEAAAALGIPRRYRFFRIVLPQAARAIIPNAANEVIGLVKGTSVVFIIALPELFYAVQVIYNRNSRVIPLLLVAVVWYAILTTLLSILQHVLERRYAKGAQRHAPDGPFDRAAARIGQWWRSLADESGAADRGSAPRAGAPTGAVRGAGATDAGAGERPRSAGAGEAAVAADVDGPATGTGRSRAAAAIVSPASASTATAAPPTDADPASAAGAAPESASASADETTDTSEETSR